MAMQPLSYLILRFNAATNWRICSNLAVALAIKDEKEKRYANRDDYQRRVHEQNAQEQQFACNH